MIHEFIRNVLDKSLLVTSMENDQLSLKGSLNKELLEFIKKNKNTIRDYFSYDNAIDDIGISKLLIALYNAEGVGRCTSDIPSLNSHQRIFEYFDFNFSKAKNHRVKRIVEINCLEPKLVEKRISRLIKNLDVFMLKFYADGRNLSIRLHEARVNYTYIKVDNRTDPWEILNQKKKDELYNFILFDIDKKLYLGLNLSHLLFDGYSTELLIESIENGCAPKMQSISYKSYLRFIEEENENSIYSSFDYWQQIDREFMNDKMLWNDSILRGSIVTESGILNGHESLDQEGMHSILANIVYHYSKKLGSNGLALKLVDTGQTETDEYGVIGFTSFHYPVYFKKESTIESTKYSIAQQMKKLVGKKRTYCSYYKSHSTAVNIRDYPVYVNFRKWNSTPRSEIFENSPKTKKYSSDISGINFVFSEFRGRIQVDLEYNSSKFGSNEILTWIEAAD